VAQVSSPGCQDTSIQACVCVVDPYCCNTNWDSICVGEVDSLSCGTCGCSQGSNIAPLATPTTSGGGSDAFGYGPAQLNNLQYEASCNFCWVTAGSSPGTAWVRYTWATSRVLWGMWLDTQAALSSNCSSSGRSLDGGTIQYWNGSIWVDVQTFSDMGDDWYPGPVPVQFDPAITTTQLRIYGVHADTLGSLKMNPLIFEWEVFECI
jgi:hypothetical protein